MKYAFLQSILLFFSVLTFSGNALYAQSSLRTTGAIQWVNIGDVDVAGDQLTVEALIHYTGASVNIVSKHTDPSNVNYLLRIGSFEITTTAGFANFGGVAAAGVTLVPGTTYHVAATYNGQFLRYYVNGCLTGEMPWTGTMVQSNLATAIAQQSFCQCEQYIGYIDEVRIWSVARTQAQIASNMLDLPTPTLQPGLVAYYKFDGNLINLQGNAAFNGTMVGPALFEQIPYPFPSTIHQTVSSSHPVCDGDANGAINIQTSGAYTPYQYSVDGVTFSSTPDFSNLSAGNYTVISRPQNNANCQVSTPITLSDPASIQSGLATTNVSCFGANNGSASVTPSGGDGPMYRVEWSTGATGNSISNLAPGNYSVNITDSCGRSGNELVNNGGFEFGNAGFTSDYTNCTNCLAGFNDVPAANYVIGHNAISHHGAFVGTGEGGAGMFMIVNGAGTPNTNVWCQTIAVQPNTYYFFSTSVTTLVASSPAQLQFEVNGGVIGPIFSAPAGTGTWDQFSSVWFSGSNTSATICILNQNTNLGGNDFGLDNISFKACISCTENFPFTITEPTQVQVNLNPTQVTCNGGNDGSIIANAIGGSGNLSFEWNSNPLLTTNTINGLSEGIYSVVVSDANGCTATASSTLTHLFDPQIQNIVSTDIDCSTPNGGTITVTATGANLQYSVDGGLTLQAGNSFNGLAPGNYAVVVSDNGCTVSGNATILTSGTLNISASSTNISCPGSFDGSATVNILSGNGNYTFSWNTIPVQNTQTINGLNQGNYSVTVTDGNGCLATDQVLVGLDADPQIDQVVVLNVSCFGSNDGSVQVVASGSNLQYSLDGGITFQAGNTFNGLGSGIYDVVIQQNACQDAGTVTITEPAELTLSITTQNASCFNACDGLANATVNGGVLDYSYLWSGGIAGIASPTANALCAGNYSLTVTDANGCQVTENFSIAQPPALTIDALVPVGETCPGFCDASVVVVAPNAVNFQISGGGANPSGIFSDLCPGNYSITLTDAAGCSISQAVNLVQAPEVVADFSASSLIVSELQPNVQFTNTSQGALSYSWDFASVATDIALDPEFRFSGFDPGFYPVCLIAINANACTDTMCLNIEVREDLLVYVPNSFSPNFEGKNDVFHPVCLACVRSEYVFRIYNRWGEIVFQTEDPTAGWDGTLGGGIRAHSGTYVWHMQFMLEGDVVVHTLRGHVNLLR